MLEETELEELDVLTELEELDELDELEELDVLDDCGLLEELCELADDCGLLEEDELLSAVPSIIACSSLSG